MKQRITALTLALVLAFCLSACGGTAQTAPTPDTAPTDSPAPTPEPAGEPGEPEEAPTARALSITVNSETGDMEITRSLPRSAGNLGDPEMWTIFVYLCGTDLESTGGMGTGDLIEMLDADTRGNARFVVQTGGTDGWYNQVVDSRRIQRFLIQDGEIELMDEQPLAGMGTSNTLSDFLSWGVANYASTHMGLILWNHGGGAITGVCFDEMYRYDSLDLQELDAALYQGVGVTGRRLDFVGFDACLMGTVETANVVASYANYMIGSEETEPGSGWDYTAIGSFLGSTPDADGAALGAVVCDSFLAACEELDEDRLTTLSVLDLSALDALLLRFNEFARSMFEAAEDPDTRARMIRDIGYADNFGGNNRTEGYTNMVDMGGIITACSAYVSGAQETLDALAEVVVYAVNGPYHSGASGLSMYYPLSVQGSEELAVFSAVSVSPYYVSFVDRQNQSGAAVIADGDYDDEQWFDDSGSWSWGQPDEDGHWNYLDGYEQTGESPWITFETPPHLDADGDFWFVLDDDGWYYAADVYGLVYEFSEDGEDILELGQTYDLNADWDYGFFMDDFDGWWISLPDGQNLATYIVEAGEDYVIYTSPILLNGEETNLRLLLDYAEGTMSIEGAWDGIDEYGAAAREIVKLEEGDEIVPVYYAWSLETEEDFEYVGWTYTVEGEPELVYDIMEDGDYLFAFCIEDIFGDYYLTDFVMFNVEDGEVYFYEE